MTGTAGRVRTERGEGLSVQARLTAAVGVLLSIALAGAGVIVYAIEREQLDARNIAEVEQELDEFAILHQDGPAPGQPAGSVHDLLEVFLQRNVPDTDELLVGWVGDRPALQFPADELTEEPAFLSVAGRLAEDGGSAHLDTDRGDTLVTAQPITVGGESGALVVVAFLDDERGQLRETMRTYVVVALLALLLATALAAWLSGRLLAPLRALRETAEEISATDLSRRLPLRGNDDITALTSTVNGMLDRLEAAFTGQRRFLDDAGHELRTPLTVVRGHLELLDAADPADVAATRELVLDEVDRMARLVGDLILLAKSDRPDFLAPEPTDVGGLTLDLLAKARALGDRAWTLDGAADVTVVADEQRLTQAVLQLCDNAVKHTAPGDLVAIGSRVEGEEVRLWVRDSGPGIPADQREHVFSRFGRARVPRGDEGFGLGLSIVRAIAEAHGGRAWIEDATPSGAVVVLAVPLRPAPSEDALTEELPAWPAS